MPVALGGGTRLVPLALRAAARARLPVRGQRRLAVNELDDADWRRVLAPSLMFVASFSAIFILLGLTATGLGRTLCASTATRSNTIAGVVIIAMGVLFVVACSWPRLNREWRVDGADGSAPARAARWSPGRVRGSRGPPASARPCRRSWPPPRSRTRSATARSCSRSTPPGSRSRSCSPALAFSRTTTAFAVGQAPLRGDHRRRRRDPDRDGRPDPDRRVLPPQHRGPEAAQRARASTSPRTSSVAHAMSKLIYTAITSLDGYVADSDGNWDWSAPDEAVHLLVRCAPVPVAVAVGDVAVERRDRGIDQLGHGGRDTRRPRRR